MVSYQAAAVLHHVAHAGLSWPPLPEQPTGPELVAAAKDAAALLQGLAATKGTSELSIMIA